MQRAFSASIQWDNDAQHPDAPNQTGNTFTDTYRFDTNVFSGGNDPEAMRSYIRRDLALVAGGGYDTDHIANVHYTITEVTA